MSSTTSSNPTTTSTTTNSTTSRPKPCRFIASSRGCKLGQECSFSHDPKAVNAYYKPQYPLGYCQTKNCPQVTTFSYCKQCYYENLEYQRQQEEQEQKQYEAELPQYKCANKTCNNMTTKTKCNSCYQVESQYMRRGTTSHFGDR